jgi:hypothetical protein
LLIGRDGRGQAHIACPLAGERQETGTDDQHDADQHRQVDPVAEDKIAEQDGPEHLAVLGWPDHGGGRIVGGIHQPDGRQRSQQPIAREHGPLLQCRPMEIRDHQYAEDDENAKHAGAVERDVFFRRSDGAIDDDRDRSGKPGKHRADMPDRKLAETRAQDDKNADEADDDSAPAPYPDRFLEKQNRHDRHKGRQ